METEVSKRRMGLGVESGRGLGTSCAPPSPEDISSWNAVCSTVHMKSQNVDSPKGWQTANTQNKLDRNMQR